jgi:hypothetical protein
VTTGRGADDRQLDFPFGQPQQRRHDAKRIEYDERGLLRVLSHAFSVHFSAAFVSMRGAIKSNLAWY